VRNRIFFGFRTFFRPIQPEIQDDTIQAGAETQKTSFPHFAVRVPVSCIIIILLKPHASYTFTGFSDNSPAMLPVSPEWAIGNRVIFCRTVP